jgi:hypothetical protein
MGARDVAAFCLGAVFAIAISDIFAAPPSNEEISSKEREMEMLLRIMPIWCGNDGCQ